MKHLFSIFNVLAALLLAGAIYAVGWAGRTPERPETPTYVLSERLPVQTQVYYLNPQTRKLQAEPRNVPVVQGDQNPQGIAAAALSMWSQGPADSALKSLVPADVPAPGVWLRGDNYFVSLPEGYRSLGYSVSGEYLTLCSITLTLLENDGLDVTFLVDGKNVSTIGHMDLRQPLTRQDCRDL